MSLVRRTCGGFSSNEAPFFFFKKVAYLACCRDKMNNCASFFAGVVLVKGEMLENSLASLDDCNNNNELTTDQSQKRAFLLQVSASLKREGLTDYYCSQSCKNVVKSLRCKCRYKKIDRQARQARQLALAQATLRPTAEPTRRCPICLEDLDDAPALACGHKFHAACVQELAAAAWADGARRSRDRGTAVLCPLCRAQSYVK